MRLLADSRLSDAARVLGLTLSTLEGPQETPYEALAVYLHGTPNRDTVGRHLRQLLLYGYVRKASSGGSGSPVYEWIGEPAESLPAKIHAQTNSLPVKIHAQDGFARENSRAEHPVVVVGEVVDITPLPPLPAEPDGNPIDPRAVAAIEAAGEHLAGCRGALVDYLRARVPLALQYAYVQTVHAWAANPLATFRRPDGHPVPEGERARLLAVALNEMAATDEGTRKYRPGDPANLRTKLQNVIAARFDDRSRRNGNGNGNGYGAKRGAPADAQDYGTGTTEWGGLNG
jgi:hypothetical protein